MAKTIWDVPGPPPAPSPELSTSCEVLKSIGGGGGVGGVSPAPDKYYTVKNEKKSIFGTNGICFQNVFGRTEYFEKIQYFKIF